MNQSTMSKEDYAKIFERARDIYIERGNVECNRYLTHREMVARAYYEAVLSVINENSLKTQDTKNQ